MRNVTGKVQVCVEEIIAGGTINDGKELIKEEKLTGIKRKSDKHQGNKAHRTETSKTAFMNCIKKKGKEKENPTLRKELNE